MIIALLGKAGAGKTTIAEALEKEIPNSFVIDGDDLRAETSNTDVGIVGREKNIHLGYKRARWLSDLGFTVFVAMQAPIREIRREYLTSSDLQIVINNTGYNPRDEQGYNKNFQADYSDADDIYDFDYETFDVQDFIEKYIPRVLVIARFQGMHRGHQIVLETAKRISPRITIALRVDEGDQLDLQKNIDLLKEMGYDVIQSPDLDEPERVWEEFVDGYQYVVQGNPDVIRKFQSDFNLEKFLEQRPVARPIKIPLKNTTLVYVPRVGHISATKIREAIKNGDDEFALKYVSKEVFDFLKDELGT